VRIKKEQNLIAISFTELINNIYNYTGDYFYWKDNPELAGYGDAYSYK